MEGANRKALILDCTMKIVSKYGLQAFTTKKLSEYMGISEALVYRHFKTKEDLLWNCFDVVNRKIAALITQLILDEIKEKELSFDEFIHMMWLSYFSLLIEEDYRTLFYFSYRDSVYIKTVLRNDDEIQNTYFKDFIIFIKEYDKKNNVLDRVGNRFIWTYILDTTGMFAKRTIMGEMEKSSQNTEIIWNMIFKGISGLLNI